MGGGVDVDAGADLSDLPDLHGRAVEDDAAEVQEGAGADGQIPAVVALERRLEPGFLAERGEQLAGDRGPLGGIARVQPGEKPASAALGGELGIRAPVHLACEHLVALGAQRPTETTRARQAPRGASTWTSSPALAPTSALPSGDAGETPPTLEISTSIGSPSSRRSIVTRDPTATSPLFAAASSSTSSARCRRLRRIVMRRSRRPCSVLAAWYSKFSERSPKPRGLDRLDDLGALGALELGQLGFELRLLGTGEVLGSVVHDHPP